MSANVPGTPDSLSGPVSGDTTGEQDLGTRGTRRFTAMGFLSPTESSPALLQGQQISSALWIAEVTTLLPTAVTLADRPQFRGPADIARWCAPYLAHLPYETALLLVTDADRFLLGVIEVGRGDTQAVQPDRLTILRALLTATAKGLGAAWFLCHNHPLGRLTFSQADRETTLQLRQIGDLIGVPLVDHVLVTSDGRWRAWRDDDEGEI